MKEKSESERSIPKDRTGAGRLSHRKEEGLICESAPKEYFRFSQRATITNSHCGGGEMKKVERAGDYREKTKRVREEAARTDDAL